ncbi:MAG TPA: hypothetical protein VMF55_03055 [Solirubrobacterales bacterium]|nr:hypothetical protein [Solirubrobacterales bacterium]
MANWGRRDWWSALADSDAPSEEFDRGCLEDIDLLVGELRNSIHGKILGSELRERVEPTDPAAVTGYPRQTVVLDGELGGALLPAVERQGGPSRWAIHRISAAGAAWFDPWRYADAAIATTGEALSWVLAALAQTPDFSGLADDAGVRTLYLGRVVQRENARLLFGVESLPTPPRRVP